jgi:hypothetical protein
MEARWINARCGIQTRSVRKRLFVDEWENETGESAYESWSTPAKLMLNVSPPTGSAEANPFGAFTDYSYVVSSSSKKRNTPLYEGTHVAEHITDTKYALKEVAASEN